MFSLSCPFAPETSISRDRFGRPVPHHPAHSLHRSSQQQENLEVAKRANYFTLEILQLYFTFLLAILRAAITRVETAAHCQAPILNNK